MYINSEEELRKLYGWPKGRAKNKVLTRLEKHSKHFITSSPFLVISTFNSKGNADASPRGGNPGFVKILDDQNILIPDAKGNNWVESLVNIVASGSVGCLFMIPGINETLRLNGKAKISTASKHLDLFSEDKIPPKTCIKVQIEEVFLHCAKAFMRSKLWEDDFRQTRPGFPTMGTMLNDQLGLPQDGESQEEMEKRYQADL